MAIPIQFVIKRNRNILHKWHHTSWQRGDHMGETVCGINVEYSDDRNLHTTARFKKTKKCKRCFKEVKQ